MPPRPLAAERCTVFDVPGARDARSFFDWQPPDGVIVHQRCFQAHISEETGRPDYGQAFSASCRCGRKVGERQTRADAIEDLGKLHPRNPSTVVPDP